MTTITLQVSGQGTIWNPYVLTRPAPPEEPPAPVGAPIAPRAPIIPMGAHA